MSAWELKQAVADYIWLQYGLTSGGYRVDNKRNYADDGSLVSVEFSIGFYVANITAPTLNQPLIIK